MTAGASLAGKVFAKKGGEVRGELRHIGAPRCKAAPADAMWAVNSGVAWRYQWASVTWVCPN